MAGETGINVTQRREAVNRVLTLAEGSGPTKASAAGPILISGQYWHATWYDMNRTILLGHWRIRATGCRR